MTNKINFTFSSPSHYIEPTAPSIEDTFHPNLSVALPEATEANPTAVLRDIIKISPHLPIDPTPTDHIFQKEIETLLAEMLQGPYSTSLDLEQSLKTKGSSMIQMITQMILKHPLNPSFNPQMPWSSAINTAKQVIAQVNQSELSEEKKIFIDIMVRYHLVTHYACGHSEGALEMIDCMDHLQNFLTHEGHYLPVFDVKGQILKSFVFQYAQRLSLQQDRMHTNTCDLCHHFIQGVKNELLFTDNPREKSLIEDLKNAFEICFIPDLKECALQNAKERKDYTLFAQNIMTVVLSSKEGHKEAGEMLRVYLSSLSPPLPLIEQARIVQKIFSLTKHEGLKLLLADEALSVIIEHATPLYLTLGQKKELPTHWMEDMQQIFSMLDGHIEIDTLFPSNKKLIAKELRPSLPLFQFYIQSIKQDAMNNCLLQIKREKRPLSLQEKSKIYQQEIQKRVDKTIQAVRIKEQAKAREILSRTIAAILVKELCFERDPYWIANAKEEFESSGYLPLLFFSEVNALQELLTLSGGFSIDIHLIQEDIGRIFPAEFIQNRLEVIDNKRTTGLRALDRAQKKTLQWALQIASDPYKVAPSILDMIEADLVQNKIDALLEEIRQLRGEHGYSGTIDQAWVDYLHALANYILQYDEIAPPIDKEKMSNVEIGKIQKALGDTSQLREISSLLFAISRSEHFGKLTLGALTVQDYFQYTDLKAFEQAKKECNAQKEKYEKLKLYEEELVGCGMSAKPILNEAQEIVDYEAKEGSRLKLLAQEMQKA